MRSFVWPNDCLIANQMTFFNPYGWLNFKKLHSKWSKRKWMHLHLTWIIVDVTWFYIVYLSMYVQRTLYVHTSYIFALFLEWPNFLLNGFILHNFVVMCIATCNILSSSLALCVRGMMSIELSQCLVYNVQHRAKITATNPNHMHNTHACCMLLKWVCYIYDVSVNLDEYSFWMAKNLQSITIFVVFNIKKNHLKFPNWDAPQKFLSRN